MCERHCNGGVRATTSQVMMPECVVHRGTVMKRILIEGLKVRPNNSKMPIYVLFKKNAKL